MAKEHEIKLNYKEYNDESELCNADAKLLERAEEALNYSYSPYSEFKVGAALLMENGEMYIGSNQENASFPAGICAERSAISNAKHQNHGRILKIAITVRAENFEVNSPIAPCGVCRQVMLESELDQNSNIEVILKGSKGSIYTLSNVKGLLPLHFFEKGLKKGTIN